MGKLSFRRNPSLRRGGKSLKAVWTDPPVPVLLFIPKETVLAVLG